MTYKFGTRSARELATLHVDLQTVCHAVLEQHDFAITEGHRGQVAQEAAKFAGKSKLDWPKSKHNQQPSLAMDLLPFINGKPIAWGDREQWVFFGGIVLATAERLYRGGLIKHRLRWGSDWNRNNDVGDEKFIDSPHFELERP